MLLWGKKETCFVSKLYGIMSRTIQNRKGNDHGDEVYWQQPLCGVPGFDERCEYCGHAAKTPADQRRAGHWQDYAGTGGGGGPGKEAHYLEREIHHQGSGRPVRL